MSTNASFAPIAFPEMGTARRAEPQPQPPRVTPGYEYDEDMRTRPVAVRMTPLAYPELVKDETPEVRERARVQGHAAGYAAGRKAATETLATDRARSALRPTVRSACRSRACARRSTPCARPPGS